jgi:hypothetical protein
MELPTIEMSPKEARQRFEEYRREVRRKHDAEDEAIARGYKALADGTPLIRLSAAIKLGGVTEARMNRSRLTVPRLAVCRADQPFAWTNGVRDDGSIVIAGKRHHSPLNQCDVFRFPARTLKKLDGTEQGRSSWSGNYPLNALVPNIPPPLRPRAGKRGHQLALRGFHILWEAEWRVAPGPPPGDPALLKHIGGDLYAVHAVWDLTELEQAVLAGRTFEE